MSYSPTRSAASFILTAGEGKEGFLFSIELYFFWLFLDMTNWEGVEGANTVDKDLNRAKDITDNPELCIQFFIR